ncbi:MAG: hypothetical protein RLZZ543_586 [Bacteroidota bacterium]
MSKCISKSGFILPIGLVFFLIASAFVQTAPRPASTHQFLVYEVDPLKFKIALYWKDEQGNLLNNAAGLKSYLEKKKETLLFSTNAGMYQQDQSPLGLFIQQGEELHPINLKVASGNFYLKPNGVFYMKRNRSAGICRSEDFKKSKEILFATQSGPMLVIDGQLHPAFKKGSVNTNVRNGVGVLANGHVLFVMSKSEVNFYDFATFFQEAGCKNALYLDGFVSRSYLPEQSWKQLDGQFGVMIGVSRPQ